MTADDRRRRAAPRGARAARAALGVAERVRVRRPRRPGRDRRATTHAADVFCLPSFAEGVPVVLMEAMAIGVPVVATRINGIPELIEDGESGVLVTPGRADLLAAALRDMLADGARRAALAAAGRRRVAADFEVDACAGELHALMERHGILPGATSRFGASHPLSRRACVALSAGRAQPTGARLPRHRGSRSPQRRRTSTAPQIRQGVVDAAGALGLAALVDEHLPRERRQ